MSLIVESSSSTAALIRQPTSGSGDQRRAALHLQPDGEQPPNHDEGHDLLGDRDTSLRRQE
jgi:hypothetical protein